MEESDAKASLVLETIQSNFERLWKKFSVLEPLKLRVRPMNFDPCRQSGYACESLNQNLSDY